MKTVHLIQHTHWDREWYFTENDSKIVLYYFMLDLITRLEQDEALGPFILDGQTVMLEDFLQVAPEHRARLQKLIADGRVLIGPWYTQSDFLVVGAESITRNLLLGLADCNAWGSYMPVGYVPDSFGQSAQLPMFLSEFAIDSAVLWRGWCEHDVPTSEFCWQAQGGQQVLTAVLPWGYGCAKWLPTASQELAEKLPPILEKQGRFSAMNHLLLPNGNDQSPFEYAVPGALVKLNASQNEYHFRRSSFSDFFAALRSDEHKLPVLRGELLSPKYMRIHRGIFSTRMDIKQLNASLEQFVSQTLEPLLALNWRLGLPYPQQAVEHIWREAMQSHAHDSIGGCNSDRVNQMVKGRLQSGKESAGQLFELNMKMLAEGITASQHGKKIVVFNPLPARRDTQVSLTLYTPEEDFRIVDGEGNLCRWQLLHEEQQDMSQVVQELANSTTTTWYRKCHILLEAKALPACGYQTFYLQEGEAAGFEIPASEGDCLENAWLRLEHTAGELTLTDKRTGEVYPHILRLVDGEDAGDNYNYSPPAADWKIDGEGCLQQAMLTRGVLKDTMQLTLHIPAPADADARRARRLDARLDVVMTISLPHESAWLDVAVEVNNTLRDHRLQIELPTGLYQSTHFADQPFGLIERENVPRALEIWQQENWTEAPASLWPMQSLVMMHHAQRGLGVVTAGLREYEIPVGQADTLAITLFRSVGWLGRPALEWRPWRASGMVLPSPDSQLPGRHAFHLAVIPMENGQCPAFWQAVEQWRTPASGYLDSGWSRFRTNPHGKSFPPHFSVLSWESAVHFSTLKKAQNEEALVLRGWNPGLAELENLPPTVNATPQQIALAERPTVPTVSVAACTPVSWLIRSFE